MKNSKRLLASVCTLTPLLCYLVIPPLFTKPDEDVPPLPGISKERDIAHMERVLLERGGQAKATAGSIRSHISKLSASQPGREVGTRIDGLKYPYVIGEEVSGQLLVWSATHAIAGFPEGLSQADLERLNASGFTVTAPLRPRIHLVQWNPTLDLATQFDQNAAALQQLIPGVRVERDYLVYQQATEDGSWWESDVSMEYIRSRSLRADGQVIAVLDTGINFGHEDLAGAEYLNPLETMDGRDSDGNGFVDDLSGYDFVDLDPQPMDEEGHGTAMAGAIAALDNGVGIHGVAQGAKLLNIRVMDGSGTGFQSDLIKGVEYARLQGATVINMSLGGPGYSQTLEESLQDAVNAGAICIAAAGNDGKSIDGSFQVYPANFKIDGLVAVGAYGRNWIPSFSNYGQTEVDWLLPGENILLPGLGETEYAQVSGTSVSAAIMSGIVALLKNSSAAPGWAEIQEKLIQSSRPNMAWKARVANYGYVRVDGFLENDFIQVPELGISVVTSDYYVGEPVAISVGDHPHGEGNLTWLRNGIPFGNNGSTQIVVAPHPEEAVEFSCVLDTYFAHLEASPVTLNPNTGPLQLSSDFQRVIEVPFGTPFQLAAPVEGSPPISVDWYDEDGNLLVQDYDTLGFTAFLPGNQTGYYFTASNGTGILTSPLINLKVANLGLMRSVAVVDPRVIDVGNGIYLSNLGISVDGISWHSCSSQLPGQFDRMFFWKGAFYGYTYSYSLIDALYRSEYGAAWSQIAVPRGMTRISPMGDVLMALSSDGGYLSSTDAVDWIPLASIADVGFAGGKFFANLDGQAVYSADLADWEVPSGVSGPYYSVVYAEGLWLASGNGTKHYSKDGVHWSPLEGLSPSFAPRRLAFIDGAHYAFDSHAAYRIAPDLTVTLVGTGSNSPDWVALADGRIVWQASGAYYLEEGRLPDGAELLPLELVGPAELQLGEPVSFHVPLDQNDILSLKLYNQLGLVDERDSPPFFDPVMLPGLGSHHLSAVIQTRVGRTILTDSRAVEVHLTPTVSLETGTLPLRDHRIFRTAQELNLRIRDGGSIYLYEDLESGSPVLSQIPSVTTTDVFDDALFGTNMAGGSDHAFLKYTGGQWQVIEAGEPSWYSTFLAGNRLFAKVPGSADGAFSLTEYRSTGWVPVIGNLPEFVFHGGTTYPDGRSALVIRIPSLEETRYLFESIPGQWTYRRYSAFGDTQHMDSGSLLFRSEEDQVYVAGVEPFVWSRGLLQDYIALEAPNGPWLPMMTDWWQTRILSHVDGRRVLFQLEGDLSSSPDPTGRYILVLSGQATKGYPPIRLSLYPINEFSLSAGPSTPSLRNADAKLHLNISVDLLQLNLGSRVNVPCTFEIFLCKDETPSLETSIRIAERSLPLQLDLLETMSLELSAELPEGLSPGTYSVGVYLNRSNPHVPESTLGNNLVWQEWTLERYAQVEKAPLPSSARIFFTPDVPYPLVGDAISVSFSPKAGFLFSGWNPEIGTTANPAQVRLPNHLYLSAGEIPESIRGLLPDAQYSGFDFWHGSGIWGWFIGEYFPWVYHLQHGWLFFNPAGPQGSVFYFDAALGWVYFQPHFYPYLYSYSQNRWLYYLKDTASPRWFFDLATRQWNAI